MSLDYDDPSLDRLLTEHARRSRAEFTPPALDGMLSSALDAGRPRRRWVWPVLAAVLLLAIPLITVLLVRHGRIDGQPAHPNTKLVRVGPVSWADWTGPAWTGRAIEFTVELSQAQACLGEPSIQAKVTADNATSVTIVATLYVNPDPAAMSDVRKQICADPPPGGKGYADGVVELPEPLHGRVVIDGTTHTTFRVPDASSVPSIPGLPSDFSSQGYYARTDNGLVGRKWGDRQVQITLGMMPYDPAIWSDGKPSTIGLVNGHETETLDEAHQILWKNGAYIYVIGEMPLNLTNDYEFSPEQLLELARTVR